MLDLINSTFEEVDNLFHLHGIVAILVYSSVSTENA